MILRMIGDDVMAKEKISLIGDTVHGTIQISKIEKEIISSSIFNRLHDISQNSTAYLTFPSSQIERSGLNILLVQCTLRGKCSIIVL